MDQSIALENIDRMRKLLGIDDVELRDEIKALEVGDSVRLTFLSTTAATGETLLVRITSVSFPSFRGKVAEDPTLNDLACIHRGKLINFKAVHIHSTSPKRSEMPQERAKP